MRGGAVFLTDFGIAKDVRTGSRHTLSGTTLGTPDYMSPEQARGELTRLTPASDVWALGCVLYEALVGRPPFPGDTAAAVVTAVLAAAPVPVRRLRPGVPPAVARALATCLRRAPPQRPHDARAAGRALDDALAGRGGRPAWWGVAAAAALAALAAAAWWARGGAPAPATPAPAPAALAERAAAERVARPAEAARLFAEALAGAPDRADWRAERGLILWSLGRTTEARAEWEAAAGAGHEPAAFYLALEALLARRATEAGERLRRVAGGTGRSARLAQVALHLSARAWPEARAALAACDGWEATLLRGYLEITAPGGDRQAGIRALDEASRYGIAGPLVLTNRGWTRFEVGDVAGALADCDAALALQPAFAEALNNRGYIRECQGDAAGAMADYEAALAADPDTAYARANLAVLRAAAAAPEQALAVCADALAREPGARRVLEARARLLRGLGRHAEAIADRQRVVEGEPDDADAWHALAYERFHAGDPAGAIPAYDEALRRSPRWALALLNRGWAHHLAGDDVAAERDLDASLALDPDSADAWQSRGRLRCAADRLDEALADFDRALGLAPNHRDGLLGRATAHHWAGRFAAAIADIDRALALGDAQRGLITTERAVCCWKAGDIAAAEATLDAALALEPGQPRALVVRVQMRRDRGDWAGVLAAGERFLREASDHRWRAGVEADMAHARAQLGR